jgi:hypothetical protein
MFLFFSPYVFKIAKFNTLPMKKDKIDTFISFRERINGMLRVTLIIRHVS